MLCKLSTLHLPSSFPSRSFLWKLKPLGLRVWWAPGDCSMSKLLSRAASQSGWLWQFQSCNYLPHHNTYRVAGQRLVGVFLYIYSRENITWFSSVLLTVSGYWKKASFQILYVHENLVLTLFIKTLPSDFILLFLFKTLWIWEGSAVTKDRWPSEACSYNSNLSYSSTFDPSWHFFDVLSMRSTRCTRLSVKQEGNFLCPFPWVCPNEQTHHQEASCMCSVMWEKVWSMRVCRVRQERIPHDPRRIKVNRELLYNFINQV